MLYDTITFGDVTGRRLSSMDSSAPTESTDARATGASYAGAGAAATGAAGAMAAPLPPPMLRLTFNSNDPT